MYKNITNEQVSIIVPIFNCQLYLKRCIESILNQTYKNLEIILIDDGSTDNSLQVCQSYQALDKRVKVLHKQNGGVSSARNIGVNNCHGKFITFVDADDYLESKFIENLLLFQHENDYDIVLSNSMDVYDDKKTTKILSKKKYELSKDQSVLEFLKAELFSPVCIDRLFKKDIIKDIRFDEKMQIAEDGKYLLNAFEKSNKNLIVPFCGYYYYIRNGSAIHCTNGFNYKWLSELSFCEELITKYPNGELGQWAKYKYIEFNMRLLSMPEISKEKELIEQIVKNLKNQKKFVKSKKIFDKKFRFKYLIFTNNVLRQLFWKFK